MTASNFAQSSPILIVAAAALIDRDGRVLVQKRPEGSSHPGLWEFPGGKIETDESPEAALVRELREELGIAVAMSACHQHVLPARLRPSAICSCSYLSAANGEENQDRFRRPSFDGSSLRNWTA